MKKAESLEEFYRRKLDTIPEKLHNKPGHFDVFRGGCFINDNGILNPYNRKDFYKIKLIIGKSRLHYADKTIEIEESALLFANPLVPYQLETLNECQSDRFCIFTEGFFNGFGNIRDYPVFNPGVGYVYTLNAVNTKEVIAIYEKMEAEIRSDYVYKSDVLKNLVYELIHKAMKLQPLSGNPNKGVDANKRIMALFLDLLELQFPLTSQQDSMKLRKPQEFAGHLTVHINHLNRAVKIASGKTTSQLIGERIIQEAKVLLKHTNWSVSEIGYCLGFEQPSHFISFFKKNNGKAKDSL